MFNYLNYGAIIHYFPAKNLFLVNKKNYLRQNAINEITFQVTNFNITHKMFVSNSAVKKVIEQALKPSTTRPLFIFKIVKVPYAARENN